MMPIGANRFRINLCQAKRKAKHPLQQQLKTAFADLGIENLEVTDNPKDAVERINAIYERSAAKLKDAFVAYAREDRIPQTIESYYPFAGVVIDAEALNFDARISYGILHDPGVYGTTLTRPDLFGDYYEQQLAIIRKHHNVPIVTGISQRPLPLPYVVECIKEYNQLFASSIKLNSSI